MTASTYPAPPTPQAVNISTFTPPPIDGSISTPQMIDFHLANNSAHPLFRFSTADTFKPPFEDILWRDAGQAIHRAARYAQAHIGTPSDITSAGSTKPPVIVVFAPAEFLHYSVFVYGVLRAGYVAHLISHRKSPAVLAHLFLKTDVTHVFVDESMRGLMNSVFHELQKEANAIIPTVFDFPAFADLFVKDDSQFQALPAMKNAHLDSTALIMNSSGSTSLPKAIYFTHRGLLEWSRSPWYGDRDLFRDVLGMQAAFPFYGAGYLYLASAFASGCICAVRSPLGKSTAITPEGLLGEAVATQATVVYSPPSLLEAWASNPSAITALSKFKIILYGGAPLREDVGSTLIASGVNISCSYAATEVGTISKLLPDTQPADDWDHFELSPQASPYLKPVEGHPGVFELVIFSTPTHQLQVRNIEIDGKPAYATGDLLVKHPKNPEKYKIVGRVDDQLALSTGVKLNPLSVEVAIKASPIVNGALIFGAGRPKLGILIEPAEPIDSTNPDAVLDFREAIWKTVDDANAINGHIRIAKEMIITTNPAKPFLYTEKGSIRRSAVMKLYAEEIEGAYATGGCFK
ncbi:hypothetical protein BOTBODRAFT_146290 [Botryobasidium botryosum FD-172 SS1]|uniref:AMP-dependent synthetase/ligase domain-containing protein n=1 Tax=Botryobasidium botryosum (strain FD-172 SS1) TaxID=930990 RepID=A0A067MBP0_BOTB1|nr:hypothetical protein BOTBODRAFT_146290 [Botryobasidium botryosum FD-172 SS1]